MAWGKLARRLWRSRRRRQRSISRTAELLEARVLLTNVAYYDLLKGQNFVQSGTGNPALQSGSPFHLHSSVHSPTGFVSAASIQLPNNTTRTLVEQGSTQFRSLEQSFSTKTALDATFATGNYTFTISQPMSVNFSPALDASAGVNLPPGSRRFDGQVFEPDLAGNFHEVWSPTTPNTLDADGTITATTMTATLTGHVNTSATGSINATWDGSQYVGTYTFSGQNGTATIPDGFQATLNLPADAYPNAPHITNFTAAQTVNPAAEFTFNWDAFAGGTTSDLITLFIFDGNNQVFHTNPIPLPSSDPLLNGTATSFTLPRNTLQANKTYTGQLWFTNLTTLDTTSFPGATGATGYYIATNFTIKTGTAVDTGPPDVVAYYVTKAQQFEQSGTGAPTLSNDFPFFFAAFVEPREDGTVNDATVTPPTNNVENGPQELEPTDDEGFAFFDEFDTKAALDAAFKTGRYTFAIDTVNQGVRSPSVSLPSESYPVTPHISNWADAQMIDANSDFTLNWDAFTSGTTGDFIQVSIVNLLDEVVLESPGFWETNPLNGTSRSFVIPAGMLDAGETYSAELLFANASTLDRTTYPNAIGTTAYSKLTTFTLQTIPPEGILQFETTGFSVNENADPHMATIAVTRIGGSQGEVEIEFSTSNGSAEDGSDYTGITGTLTFADGQTTQTFDIPIVDDERSEGHETVALRLMNPTNGATLGTRATATLTILDNELTFGPGNFIDSDGDKYTVKLSGPGTARIALNDPDGDGRGSIAAILLSDTTTSSSITVTVTKVTGGDGEVSIGRATGAGNLSSFSAAKSDLTGNGFNFDGFVGQITVDDVLGGADLMVGGAPANMTKFTLGEVAAGTELRSGATISTLIAQTFLGDLIQAPAITTLTINTGSFPTDLNVTNAIKTLTVKAGGASGDWLAGSFGTVSITGGGFSGDLRSNATAAALGTTPAISSFTITGGDLVGGLNAQGLIGTLKTVKNSANNGGSILNSTISASGFNTVSIGRDLMNVVLLAGAQLGEDGVIGGAGADADTFGGGKIGSFTVTGDVVSSVVGAGLDPQRTLFNRDVDRIIGGVASAIPAMSIGGIATTDSYFAAGLFPVTVKIGTVSVNPRIDPRFFTGTTTILDDGDPGFTVAGSWAATTTAGFLKDFRSNASGSGADTATWSFVVDPGMYRVSATWSAGTGRATNSPFRISDGVSVLSTATVDQTQLPNDFSDAGVAWENLGSTISVFGNTLIVKLTDQANGNVIADAIRVEKLSELTELPGLGSDLVSLHFPDLVFPQPAARDYVVLGESFSMSFREILLAFKEGTTVQEANAVLAASNAAIVGALPEGNLLLVKLAISDPTDLVPTLATFNADPHVEFAVNEFGGGEESLPPSNIQPGLWEWTTPDTLGSGSAGNWGLELVRAPQMWNLDTFVRRQVTTNRISAGVVDAGFTDVLSAPGTSTHPDFRRADGTPILQISPTFTLSGATTLPTGTTAGAGTVGASDHGTMVAGIIGGSWDNRLGVEGINPWLDTIQGRASVFRSEAVLPDGRLGHTTWGRQLAELIYLLRRDPTIKAVNNSYGMSRFYIDPEVSDVPRLVDPTMDLYGPAVDADGDGIREQFGWLMDSDGDGFADDTDSDGVADVSGIDLDRNGIADTFQDVVNRYGDIYVNALGGFAASTRDDFLIVASAGNANGNGLNYDTADNSPIGNASTKNLHFLAVESINRSNQSSSFSDSGGSVSAPGESVRSTETNRDPGGTFQNALGANVFERPFNFDRSNGFPVTWRDGFSGNPVDPSFATGSGTSFAAPFVTGLITALWKLAPTLDFGEIRDLVTHVDFTHQIATALRAPRIDAFAATMGIDVLTGDTLIQRSLVDVDDGTLDGNSRIDLDDNNRNGRTDDEITAILSTGGRRGDNVVDMKDFRAFRDALLQVFAEEGGLASAVALDGRIDHPKKDLNGDGRVVTPTTTGSFPSENVYPRFDFNGNGTIEVFGSLTTPGPQGIAPFKIDPDTPVDENTELTDVADLAGIKRDLDVLLGVWSPAAEDDVPRDELLDDLDGNGVVDFLLSADLHFTLDKGLAPVDDFDIKIEALRDGNVVWDRTIDVDASWSKTTSTSGETLRRIITVPLFGQRDVRVTVSNADGSATETFMALSFGQDRLVKLVAPKFTAADLRRNEGTSSSGGTTAFRVGVTLASAIPGPTTVNFETNDVTASAGEDYTAVTNGVAAFARNSLTPATAPTVTVRADTNIESDETFELSLRSNSAVNAVTTAGPTLFFVVPVTATVTIVNDDRLAAGSEMWRADLTGNTVGPFISILGSDAFYTNTATLLVTVPSPGLVSIANNPFGGVKTFNGTFSNIETVVPATGPDYNRTLTPQPTINLPVTVRSGFGLPAVEISHATQFLIPGLFARSGDDLHLNARVLTLEIDVSTSTSLSGTWRATTIANEAVFAGGDFVFTRLAGLQASSRATPELSEDRDLVPDDIDSALTEAMRLWGATGSLPRPQVVITDLPGTYLGAAGRGVIYLDRNAAGFGWFVDLTPDTHEEFVANSATSFRATDQSFAQERIDLLTVLTHELGHLLDEPHREDCSHSDAVMSGTLPTGTRRLP